MQQPQDFRSSKNTCQDEPWLALYKCSDAVAKTFAKLSENDYRELFGAPVDADFGRTDDALFGDRSDRRRRLGDLVRCELSQTGELLFAIVKEPKTGKLYRFEVNNLTGKLRRRGSVAD